MSAPAERCPFCGGRGVLIYRHVYIDACGEEHIRSWEQTEWHDNVKQDERYVGCTACNFSVREALWPQRPREKQLQTSLMEAASMMATGGCALLEAGARIESLDIDRNEAVNALRKACHCLVEALNGVTGPDWAKQASAVIAKTDEIDRKVPDATGPSHQDLMRRMVLRPTHV